MMQTPINNHISVSLIHYFYFIQGVIMLVCTVLTATHHAPSIVKTPRVTYKVDRVLAVNLDGLECIVIQVRWHILSFLFKSYPIVMFYFYFNWI